MDNNTKTGYLVLHKKSEALQWIFINEYRYDIPKCGDVIKYPSNEYDEGLLIHTSMQDAKESRERVIDSNDHYILFVSFSECDHFDKDFNEYQYVKEVKVIRVC